MCTFRVCVSVSKTKDCYKGVCLHCFVIYFSQAIEQCITATGYSVGEYAALVFAGALNFEDGEH